MAQPIDFTVNLVAATLDLTVCDAENVVAALLDSRLAEERGPDRYVIAAGVDVDAFPTPEDLQRCNAWRVREAALADRVLNPHSLRLSAVYQDLHVQVPAVDEVRAWFRPRRRELLDLLHSLVATIPGTGAGVRRTGTTALAVALTEALWGLCRAAGAIEDADAALGLGLQAVPQADARTAAVLRARLASVLADRGRVEAAVDELDAAVGFARDAGDLRVTGLVLATRGRVLALAGKAAAAVEDLRAGLTIAQGRGDTRVVGKLELALGSALRDLSATDVAAVHLTVATGLLAAFGDDVGQARAEVALASVLTTQGRPAQALRLLEIALRVLRRHGNPAYLADACHQRCLALLADGCRPEEVRAAGAEAVQCYRTVGRHDLADALQLHMATAIDSG
ncbi:hypothetical protein [Kutzneria sp. 744]|uniref:hypothetical protein n=1 Tax=Kutzneria sp. (strain 744) TaxID=345341 RepID=UPI0003EECB33|nr:hypothetical protein [Kutzneria sp. 744]EWM19839.1 LigA protein [Kutzneria sp. 744]